MGAVEVPAIVTQRLELVSMPLECIVAGLEGDRRRAERALGVALPEGWPAEEDLSVLRYRRADLTERPEAQPWLLRAMVPRAGPREMIGHIGFHSPPDQRGAVEVGYSVFPPWRRRGFAIEAVRALFGWARREHGVHHFIASVGPTNQPSLQLIGKLGFRQTGVQWDELDGEELVFELQLGGPHAG